MDQLISVQPGIVPQSKDSHTRARIWAAAVFVDYVSGFVNVGLTTDQSGDASLQSKHDSKHICSTRGVKVKAYHADNGRFAEHSFLSDCKRCVQRLTFCGTGAHHQNGFLKMQ